MRYVYLFVLGLWSGLVQAQEVDDLRLVQVLANFPTMTIWANLPTGTTIERTQFHITIGEHSAKVFGIDTFQETGEGVGYIFLVDDSKYLGSRQLVQIKHALHHWLQRLGPKDKAALISFGHEVGHDLQFTTDYFKLGNAINMLAITDVETGLYHGLVEAISLGRSRNPDLPDRRAIVVLSDGLDDSQSGASLQDVLRQTKEYRVPIYSIGFVFEPISDHQRVGLDGLENLSQLSGGYFIQADAHQLNDAFERLYRRVSQAYRLRVDCPTCTVDTHLHHLSINWNDGRRSLREELDMRLLPKPAHRQSPVRMAAHSGVGWSGFILVSGFFAFLAGLIGIYRYRLR